MLYFVSLGFAKQYKILFHYAMTNLSLLLRVLCDVVLNDDLVDGAEVVLGDVTVGCRQTVTCESAERIRTGVCSELKVKYSLFILILIDDLFFIRRKNVDLEQSRNTFSLCRLFS